MWGDGVRAEIYFPCLEQTGEGEGVEVAVGEGLVAEGDGVDTGKRREVREVRNTVVVHVADLERREGGEVERLDGVLSEF